LLMQHRAAGEFSRRARSGAAVVLDAGNQRHRYHGCEEDHSSAPDRGRRSDEEGRDGKASGRRVMSRKLILLNVVLVGIVVYTGVLLRNEMQSAKAREAKMHGARVSGTPLAAFVTLVEQQPSLAATYGRIAINTLFHPSRNSEVLLPAAPVP